PAPLAAGPGCPARVPDAGFAAVTPAPESVTVPVSAAEAWEESKESSPWAAPAQPAGDWDPTAPTSQHWSESPQASPTQDWPAPHAVADDEAAMLLRTLDEGEAGSLLSPVDEAANDAPLTARV